MRATAPTEPGVPILVVDDNQDNLLAVKAILSNPAWHVVTASSGTEALRCVLRQEFAVILLDILMPEMNGFEAARLIRERLASRHVPLIFLSAVATDMTFIYKAYSVGAVDYMTKPVDPSVLLAKVEVFVDLYKKTQQIRRQEEELRATAQKRSEAVLQENEAQYEMTFEEAPVGIAHLSLEGLWLRVNQQLCTTLCVPKKTILGLRFRDAIHPDDASEVVRAMSLMRSGDLVAYRTERRFLNGDGSPIWINLRVSLLRDSTGSPKQFIAALEDVTERKRAYESQLFLAKASESLLSTLDSHDLLTQVARMAVPQLGDSCVVQLTPDRTQGGARAPVIAGYTAPQSGEHVEPAVRRLLDATRGRISKSEMILDVAGELGDDYESAPETRGLMKTAAIKSAILVPLRAGDRILGTICFATTKVGRPHVSADMVVAEDLAHRLSFGLENARLYNEAQQAVLARDEFLSIASHELRTPLTPLQLQLQRLLSDRKNGEGARITPERLNHALERLERQVQKLIVLIDNLLDVSRITSGVLKLDPEHFDLAEVVRDVVTRLGEQLSGGSCSTELVLTPAPGRWDRLRIEQVVTNLLSNAAKYGNGKAVHVAVESDDKVARVMVRDHGIGIAPDAIERVFGRFERAVSSSKFGGLGLGLFIAHQIVRAHGGAIHVASEVGVGSLFTVELPLSVVQTETGTGAALQSEARA